MSELQFRPGCSIGTLEQDYRDLIAKYDGHDYSPDKKKLVEEEMRLIHERNYVNSDLLTIVINPGRHGKKIRINVLEK